jgi:hypothetical protein
MLLIPNTLRGLIKIRVCSLTWLFLFCFCLNAPAGNSTSAEKQTKIFQSSSHTTNDIINVFSPGVPAVAVKTKNNQNSGPNFQNKNIFKSIIFSDQTKKTSFDYLQNQVYAQRSVALRLHLALRVLLI